MAPSPAKKSPQAELLFDPSDELLFKGPAESVSKSSLVLVNKSSKVYIAFKVQATAEEHFLIGPARCLLQPGYAVIVNMDIVPAPQSTRDAFLVDGQQIKVYWRTLTKEQADTFDEYNPDALTTDNSHVKVLPCRFHRPAANAPSSGGK